LSFEGWTNTTLGEVIELKRGYDLPSHKRIEGNIPIVSSSGISGNHNEYKVKGPGVVTGRYGTIGKVFYINEPFWPLNTTLYVRDFKGNNPLFISYFLSTLNFHAYIDKAAVPGVNRNHIHMARVSVPAIPEQKRIASILKSLDDKIELNNAINKNLEEMAQALFKRWFVDFEFPNENGEPYKTSGGEFEESELGLIPKGWRVDRVSNFFDVSIGKTPPRKEAECFSFNNEDIKWLSISDMGKNGVYILNTSEYLTKEAIKKYKVKIIPKNTVVLSFKLTVGRVSILNFDMATNEAIAHFNTTDNSLVEYTYLYLSQFNYESIGSTSSIAKAVNSKTIKAMIFLMPDKNIINKFRKCISCTFDVIHKNQEETQFLINLRDTLLPKLMSGEIRVPLDQA